jgi:hypothetical protein
MAKLKTKKKKTNVVPATQPTTNSNVATTNTPTHNTSTPNVTRTVKTKKKNPYRAITKIEKLRNGDKWYVNHKRVLLVSREGGDDNTARTVYHTNYAKAILKPTDLAWCSKAPTPKPGEPSPLPIFDINGAPFGANFTGQGLGFKGGSGASEIVFISKDHSMTVPPVKKKKTKKSRDMQNVATPSQPMVVDNNLHNKDINVVIDNDADDNAIITLPLDAPSLTRETPATVAPATHHIKKKLTFTTPHPHPPVSRVAVAGADMEAGDATAAMAFILPGDDFATLPDGSLREQIIDVPAEISTEDAIHILNNKNYRDLKNLDILHILCAASTYEPAGADAKLEYLVWWQAHAHSLGPPNKLPRDLFRMYMDASRNVQASCAESEYDEDEDEGEDMETDDGPRKGGAMFAPPDDLIHKQGQHHVHHQSHPYQFDNGQPSTVGQSNVDDDDEGIITLPLDAMPASNKPKCFDRYMPTNPAHKKALEDLWEEAERLNLKHGATPLPRHKIKNPIQYAQGLLDKANDVLTMAKIPQWLRDDLDKRGEMPTTLALQKLEPTLRSEVSRHMPTPPTAASFKLAFDLEMTPQRALDELMSKVTGTKFRVKYSGGDGKFPKFLQEFTAAWDEFAVKLNFDDPEVAEDRKILKFNESLPWEVQKLLLQRCHKEFPGDLVPSTWKDMVSLVMEVDQEMSKDKRNADMAAAKNRPTGGRYGASGFRGRGGRGGRGGRVNPGGRGGRGDGGGRGDQDGGGRGDQRGGKRKHHFKKMADHWKSKKARGDGKGRGRGDKATDKNTE